MNINYKLIFFITCTLFVSGMAKATDLEKCTAACDAGRDGQPGCLKQCGYEGVAESKCNVICTSGHSGCVDKCAEEFYKIHATALRTVALSSGETSCSCSGSN